MLRTFAQYAQSRVEKAVDNYVEQFTDKGSIIPDYAQDLTKTMGTIAVTIASRSSPSLENKRRGTMDTI